MRWFQTRIDTKPLVDEADAHAVQRSVDFLRPVTRLFGLSILLAFALCVINLLFGRVYDTDHFADTQFLLGAAWRVTQGLTPVLDFDHFYGGLLEIGLAWTMLVFGPSVMVLELYAALLVLLLWALSYLILRGRVSSYTLTALFLLITILMLTRYPLELNQPIIGTVSTHSFLYNRLGLALWMISGLYVVLSPANPRNELVSGVLVGGVLVFTMLLKPTFVVIVPAVLLALAVQARWAGLAATSLGAIVVIFMLDPQQQIWSGAFSYALSNVGEQEGTGLRFLLTKALKLPLSQPIATVFALATLVYVWSTRRADGPAIAILLMAIAGVGMAVTMGGAGLFGQLGLVIAAYTTLATAAAATLGRFKHSSVLHLVNAGLVASLALPHILNLAGATLEGMARGDQATITHGPYSRYLSIPEPAEGITLKPTQYEMLADGIAALRLMGEPKNWGIVADRGISFEHALESRPVAGFPLWQRISAPEFGVGQGLPADTDVVLIGHVNGTEPIGEFLFKSLPKSFRLCRKTPFWDVYIGPDIPATCEAAS